LTEPNGDAESGVPARFVWGIADGTVRISGTNYVIAVSSTAFGNLATITEADVPTGGLLELSGAIDGGILRITAAEGGGGEVFFPNVWARRDEIRGCSRAV
jgi:hypothetical protein